MKKTNFVWKIEFKLIIIAGVSLILGLLTVCKNLDILDIRAVVLAILISIIALSVGYIKFLNRLCNGDPLILPLAVFLSNIGLIMIFRITPMLFFMQSLWVIIGIFIFSGINFFSHKLNNMINYKYICGVISFVLLLITIIYGENIGGHKSWITFSNFSVQPSEIAKIFLIFFLAAYLSEQSELLMFPKNRFWLLFFPSIRSIFSLLCVCSLIILLLIIQRDLGAALLYFCIIIGMIYMSSSRLYYILFGFILFVAGSVICYKLYEHVQLRVDMWINPWEDPSNKGYQIVQALFAFGSGSILGSGLTFGQPDMIPEVHTDFIFAAIGEEMGFIGAAAILITYIIVVYRTFRIALMASNRFQTLLAGGIGIFFSIQLFLVVGGVTNFFPLTGMTLPFISYGGSAIISNYIIFAVLYAISEVNLNEKTE